jgi:hypothetical protein
MRTSPVSGLPTSYLVVDLCALEQACACPVDGLIGADFFDGRVVQIDFDERRVRLLAKHAKLDGTAIPLTKSRGVWRLTVSANGQTLKNVRLDTGCAAGSALGQQNCAIFIRGQGSLNWPGRILRLSRSKHGAHRIGHSRRSAYRRA